VTDDIKSALEIAMEKVEKLGEATDEERLRWKYVPEGEKLAAKYIEEDVNIVSELSRYEEKAKEYVINGAMDIMVRNISLPRNDPAKRNSKRAMEGIKTLKSNKVDVENVYTKIRHIFSHYTEQGEQQRKQTYESLKAQFEAKVQQAIQQQMGLPTGVKIDVERQPQFQEEWRRTQSQLDSQYLILLDEYKQELLNID
jgi:hypothetical protein